MGKLIFAKREEQIAISNFFSNKVKRDIRNNYSYKTNYYLDVEDL
jgi:cytidylate kinase